MQFELVRLSIEEHVCEHAFGTGVEVAGIDEIILGHHRLKDGIIIVETGITLVLTHPRVSTPPRDEPEIICLPWIGVSDGKGQVHSPTYFQNSGVGHVVLDFVIIVIRMA